MPKNAVVASMASLGLLSSSLALAEVTDASAQPVKTTLEAPALVAATVATPVTVEPENEISASQHAAQPVETIDDDAPKADTLAELVTALGGEGSLDDQAKCLATAVYYEARSESLAGQLAVAHVVLQRAKSGRFPRSLCGVVTQPGQFSFVRGGRIPAVPTHAGQWRTARAITRIALAGSWENPVQGALYFHAARVQPGWNREKVTRIGGHVFYR